MTASTGFESTLAYKFFELSRTVEVWLGGNFGASFVVDFLSPTSPNFEKAAVKGVSNNSVKRTTCKQCFHKSNLPRLESVGEESGGPFINNEKIDLKNSLYFTQNLEYDLLFFLKSFQE